MASGANKPKNLINGISESQAKSDPANINADVDVPTIKPTPIMMLRYLHQSWFLDKLQ